MPYFIYLLECRDGSYYCGFTRNLQARVRAHNTKRGAKYTRARLPVRLVYSERKRTISSAMRRELEIKSYSRQKKQNLIRANSQK